MTIRIEKNANGQFIATINGVHGTVHEDVTDQIRQTILTEAEELTKKRLAARCPQYEQMQEAIAEALSALQPFADDAEG